MSKELKEMFDNFNEILYDDCIGYKQYGKTAICVSSIIKYCCKPYCIVINKNNYAIVGIIDISNKQLLRFTSNKNFTSLCKLAKLTQSKIYH